MIENVTLVLDENGTLRLAGGRTMEELNPKALLLAAAAKCAGLTALSIMQKSRMKPVGFEIAFSGELSTDTVRSESMYLNFKVDYRVVCARGEQERVARALRLTTDRYCSMIRMLRSIAPVAHEERIVATAD